jgi:lauroyl/myristoyl acyltransferase
MRDEEYTIVYSPVPNLDDPNDKIDKMIDWCNDYIGEWETDWMWAYKDGSSNPDTMFYFADATKATAFALKWT